MRDEEKRREEEERERMKKVREEGERMKSEAAKREREATATAAAQNAAQNNAASEETNRARLQELENERQEKVRAAEQARLKKQQEEEEKKRLDAKQGEERRKEEEKIKAEKKARLDQHLYGLTKSAEEEAHFRSARASGDSFEFTLKFDPEVSLGLTFDLQQDGVIVESVVGQGERVRGAKRRAEEACVLDVDVHSQYFPTWRRCCDSLAVSNVTNSPSIATRFARHSLESGCRKRRLHNRSLRWSSE